MRLADEDDDRPALTVLDYVRVPGQPRRRETVTTLTYRELDTRLRSVLATAPRPAC
ncbi:hypothetical protein [Streptomyces sp. 6N223]|uniref:hypothetical protein n=1 Tax=Streptomyces sp. 6N223 TaxID=3457412 RepID=UPI003FD10B7B